jgi:hypothetical protein
VLCALATLPRSALKTQILENSTFGVYVEQEPYVRELVEAYLSSNFKTVLELLNRYSARHALDIYLAPHVAALANMIRNWAVVLYFQPFASIKLERMSGAFGWTVGEVEEQVVALIQSGDIHGRVDSQNKVPPTLCLKSILLNTRIDSVRKADGPPRGAVCARDQGCAGHPVDEPQGPPPHASVRTCRLSDPALGASVLICSFIQATSGPDDQGAQGVQQLDFGPAPGRLSAAPEASVPAFGFRCSFVQAIFGNRNSFSFRHPLACCQCHGSLNGWTHDRIVRLLAPLLFSLP